MKIKSLCVVALVSLSAGLSAGLCQASTPTGSLTPDKGCPNHRLKGAYAPCVGILPVGATSVSQAVGVHHLSNPANQHVIKGLTVQQLVANHLLPTRLPSGAASFGLSFAMDMKGGAGQQNPTSPPPPPPPSPSCSYGFASGPTYIPARWTGWDTLGWTQGSWSYSCNPPPPPPPVFSGGYGGGGPVLCQGSYCLQPDGTVTGPVGMFGMSATVPGLVGVVDASGNIVIQQYNVNNPSAPPTTVQVITGTNAVIQSGYGIVAQTAATGIQGTDGTAVAGNQITTNATNLTTGQKSIQLGGGYTYVSSPTNTKIGQLCDASGTCVQAQQDGSTLTATLDNGNVVTSQVEMQAAGQSQNSVGTAVANTSVLSTTLYNPLTGQTTPITGTTATPNTGASSGSH